MGADLEIVRVLASVSCAVVGLVTLVAARTLAFAFALALALVCVSDSDDE